MTTFDVAVVGRGPAGAATALALAAAGRSVIVLGRREEAGCATGEILSPEAGPILTQLGVWDRFTSSGARAAHGIWSAWGSAGVVAKDFVGGPHGPGWRVDRPQFDGMLLVAARQAGAQAVLELEHIDVRRRGQGWGIAATGAGKTRVLDAGFVVDATGRAAVVARANGARRRRRDRLVALIGRMAPREGLRVAADDVLFVESAPRGWWYSSVLPGGDLVAGFLTDADLARDRPRPLVECWSDALADAEITSCRAAGFALRAFEARAAGVGGLDRAAGPGWLAVGDAASTVDPLSGFGITKALRGAILGARAVNDALSGEHDALGSYADGVQAELDGFLRMGSRYYGSERRWCEATFWRRRQEEGGPTWQKEIPSI